MDPLGMLGETTIRFTYLIFSGSILIQAYLDCGSWLRTYYIKEQLPHVWEVRYMAFCLLTATVCLIGMSYLYWVLLGAWRASRRSINQPWSALNIIQPNRPGVSSRTSDPSLHRQTSSSVFAGGLGLGNFGDQSQGFGPLEMENQWLHGATDLGLESGYGKERGAPRFNDQNNYRKPQVFLAPSFHRRETRLSSHAPQAIETPRPRSKAGSDHFQDKQDTQGMLRFATSLPQNLSNGFLAAYSSQKEDRDADGDVDMLGHRRRFH